MLVSEAMTRDVCIANPEQSLQQVAQIMAEENVGSLPVGENGHLVGMITDRDITVRAVAMAMPGDKTKVREIMTQDVKYCYSDEEIGHVAGNMGEVQLHRLPVVDRQKRLVGILALADVAKHDGPEAAGEAVHGISQETTSRRAH